MLDILAVFSCDRLFFIPQIQEVKSMRKSDNQNRNRTSNNSHALNDSQAFQGITSVEDMPAVAADIVSQYCEVHNLDESDIYPTIWNDIITELYISLFKPCNRLLKKDHAQHNEYDIDKVEYVYINIYKRLCNSHCQEISQKGFLDMTGIHKQTLYDWKNGILSTQHSDLQEKIMQDNEESLFALMKDRRNNPMKYLPKLNKVHNWNMPGVGRNQGEKKSLTDAQLPDLSSKIAEIEVKTQDIVVSDL